MLRDYQILPVCCASSSHEMFILRTSSAERGCRSEKRQLCSRFFSSRTSRMKGITTCYEKEGVCHGYRLLPRLGRTSCLENRRDESLQFPGLSSLVFPTLGKRESIYGARWTCTTYRAANDIRTALRSCRESGCKCPLLRVSLPNQISPIRKGEK